jgi:CMP-N,N'-diacetyllegionaminic acid synthase
MTPRGTLGLIPARGGSRRVPQKNIRLLGGQPLIAYTVEAAEAATALDRVIVSTDDEEIARVARKCGADVPFMRPVELAADDTPDIPVFMHALDWLAKEEGFYPELLINLRPTSPFKTGEVIDEVVEVAFETGADVVRTVTRVHGVHHPYWMFEVAEDGLAGPVLPGIDLARFHQSQLLPPVYRLNGVVDAMRVEAIRRGDAMSARNVRTVEVDEWTAMDVDTEFDFRSCELLVTERRDLLRMGGLGHAER